MLGTTSRLMPPMSLSLGNKGAVRWLSASGTSRTLMPLLERVQTHAQNGRDAVVSRDGSFHDYKDVQAKSSLIAANLQKKLGKEDLQGDRVGVLATPGHDFVSAMLAVWRSGGCAVPLCTSHPKDEMQYVLDDCGVRALLFDRSFRATADEFNLTKMDVREEGASSQEDVGYVEENPALIIYTSGTTGRPKGVVVRHSALQAQIEDQIEMWGWTQDDRILNCLPLHHVHGLVNMTAVPLSAGACIEFMEPKPDRIWQRFRMGDMVGGKLTLFMAVPTIYTRLIHDYEEMSPELQQASSRASHELRLMVSGSAPLPTTVMEKWKELTGHTLLERYGMTEFGMALSNPLKPEERRIPGFVGRPMPSVQVRIVSEETGKPIDTSSGESGELRVKGPTVFKEYWNKPEATAKEFDEEGWFKTGDIAMYDKEKDSYKILGRASADIIKSGGYKISALDIERVYLEHPAIREIAVLGIPDEVYGERVAAVVKLKEGTDLDEAKLVQLGKEKLAKYKVPTRFLFVDDIPKNAMGKVSKKQLRTELF